MKTQPTWINKQLFPFESKWISIDGYDLHYVDEGAGEVILFVHGTPEWSFGFRDLIKDLKEHYRCVAIDHLGFGLSDKTKEASYTVEAHSARLTKFIQKLGLTNINLVANDFGGGIALGYGVAHAANIKSLTLFNTWCWSLEADPHFTGPARMIESWFGRFLYKRLNAPVNVIMPQAFGDRKKLTPEVHRHYKQAVPDAESRIALYEIARQLMGASRWWETQWNKLSLVEDKPFLVFWGMKDKFIPPSQLAKWKQRLTKAEFVEFADAGHFVQEEKPEEMCAHIRRFISAQSFQPSGERSLRATEDTLHRDSRP